MTSICQNYEAALTSVAASSLPNPDLHCSGGSSKRKPSSSHLPQRLSQQAGSSSSPPRAAGGPSDGTRSILFVAVSPRLWFGIKKAQKKYLFKGMTGDEDKAERDPGQRTADELQA
ncbi:hypothetical protein P7K49_029924 [Saguinus oedipus]|uniref:Uncharacterized protein n=1 Tax=Saguinus oedipus TaxID=9490 RepID=A0ABQ9U8L2_SAGOE|nr:hypothetical protein P7K49_029924 [Saguinus oedipus]